MARQTAAVRVHPAPINLIDPPVVYPPVVEHSAPPSEGAPTGVPDVPVTAAPPDAPSTPATSQVDDISTIFLKPTRFRIAGSVPTALYAKLMALDGGASEFVREAVNNYVGDLNTVLKCALASADTIRSQQGVSQTAVARVDECIRTRVLAFLQAARERNVSKVTEAKIVSGLIWAEANKRGLL